MPLTISTVTAPTAQPLTTEEIRGYCRVDGNALDPVLAILAGSALTKVQVDSGRQLMRATLKLTLDHFPGAVPFCDQWGCVDASRGKYPIELPNPPAAAVTSIIYTDTGGTSTTLSTAAYTVDALSEPGRVVPAYGYDWPDTRDVINAVAVTYTCGYADADSVPAAAKHAMLMLIAHWFENPEAAATGMVSREIELGYNHLIASFKVPSFA